MKRKRLNPLHHKEIAKILAEHPDGLAPREVHRHYGLMARITIQQILKELVDDGRARASGEFFDRKYFYCGDAAADAQA